MPGSASLHPGYDDYAAKSPRAKDLATIISIVAEHIGPGSDVVGRKVIEIGGRRGFRTAAILPPHETIAAIRVVNASAQAEGTDDVLGEGRRTCDQDGAGDKRGHQTSHPLVHGFLLSLYSSQVLSQTRQKTRKIRKERWPQ